MSAFTGRIWWAWGFCLCSSRVGKNAESLGLTGEEIYDILGFCERLHSKFENGRTVTVAATSADGKKKTFEARIRIDTPQEIEYYKHGGILQYVLRQLATK